MKTTSSISSGISLKDRLLAAIDMMEFGIALMRQNIRRRNLSSSEEEVDKMLQNWLFEEPPGLRLVNDFEKISK